MGEMVAALRRQYLGLAADGEDCYVILLAEDLCGLSEVKG